MVVDAVVVGAHHEVVGVVVELQEEGRVLEAERRPSLYVPIDIYGYLN